MYASAHAGIQLTAGQLRPRQRPRERVIRKAANVAATSERSLHGAELLLLVASIRIIVREVGGFVQRGDVAERHGRQVFTPLIDGDRAPCTLDKRIQIRIDII
ncbi:MAG: hypothetical protein B7Y87_02055 [Sphingomonadales bacterium 32-64-22]|nr:MAG: hypothetical protein B7Y87_02055 [Sphingomonadales bacterium 32-64-22]